MTHKEFFKYHNHHIRFNFCGKTMEGVILDLYFKDKKVSTEFVFISAKNMKNWKDAQEKKDEKEMKRLEEKVDISEIAEIEIISLT